MLYAPGSVPPESEFGARDKIAILSDATGRYRWALRPGRYHVTVTAEGYEDVTREATVSPGAVASLDFVLRRSN